MRLGNKFIASLWGFAEATCFFIVPDLFLSYLALTNLRKALIACFFAVFGALAGGALMFGFAHFYYTDAVSFLDMLPAINADLIEEARLLVKNSLFFGLLEGSLTGIPYKIFAVHSGNSGVHILLFLLASIPARSLRFILVIGASAFISHVLLKHLSLKRKKQLHIGLWLLFYLGYFNHMGG